MATGKKLLNSSDSCVDEMLMGLALAHPGLSLHANHRVILRADWASDKNHVALISGGGSGHEPFCAGYVGHGMLSAVAAGSVFTSPPAGDILHAIRCVTQGNSKGALLIVANYTGDCLNFGLAEECARAEGLKVERIVVGEDCANLGQKSSVAGRRGMCGLVLVYKIAGAMAEQGKTLKDIAATSQKLVQSMATIGVSLSSCSLPGSPPLFNLAYNEMELGLGVHGEAGIQRLRLESASATVKLMLDHVANALSLASGAKVVVLINNLGGSSYLEQWVVTSEVHKQLCARGVYIQRMYAGPLMTSLEMAGVQVCIMKIDSHEEWLGYLDASTEASAWPGTVLSIPNMCQPSMCVVTASQVNLNATKVLSGPLLDNNGARIFKLCLKEAAEAIVRNEELLNDLDSGCGDGDCGSTLRKLADSILTELDNINWIDPARVLTQLAAIADEKMGGTSGALYSLLFTTAGTAMSKEKNISANTWSRVWISSLESLQRYTKARLRDRTMLDSLIPASEAFDHCPKSTTMEVIAATMTAANAARDGCESTRNMIARAGRASYVPKAYLTNVDAGAFAVQEWIVAVSLVIERELGK